jgi:hypothetical protein
MDTKFIESLKGKSREERLELFKKGKEKFAESLLEEVNGGGGKKEVHNPNSDFSPHTLWWPSSPGFICNDERVC